MNFIKYAGVQGGMMKMCLLAENSMNVVKKKINRSELSERLLGLIAGELKKGI